MKKIISFLLILILFFNCSPDEEVEQFELTTEIIPSEGGTISPSKGKFDSGKEIDLTATPAKGYFFKNWSGAVSSKENPLKIIINADKKIKAAFEKSDGDSDGVTDNVDQCPETPEGEGVDAQGCSTTQEMVSPTTSMNAQTLRKVLPLETRDAPRYQMIRTMMG